MKIPDLKILFSGPEFFYLPRRIMQKIPLCN